MPLPAPREGEVERKFIARCMSELKDEFPKQRQRSAVCFAQWKKNRDEGGDMEQRTYPFEETRVDAEGRIEGYAAVYDRESHDLGGFKEIVRRSAFTKTLKDKADVRATFNNSPNYVLGRSKAGTLELGEDDKGLRTVITPPETQWAEDLKTSMERGDINQMSFAFKVPKKGDRWSQRDDGVNIRELLSVQLHDVSIVTYPAYPQTSVAVRSIMEEEGVNPDQLSAIMVRHNKDIELSDEDRGYIASVVDILQRYLEDDSSQSLAGHVEEGSPALAHCSRAEVETIVSEYVRRWVNQFELERGVEQ